MYLSYRLLRESYFAINLFHLIHMKTIGYGLIMKAPLLMTPQRQ